MVHSSSRGDEWPNISLEAERKKPRPLKSPLNIFMVTRDCITIAVIIIRPKGKRKAKSPLGLRFSKIENPRNLKGCEVKGVTH